MSAYLVNMIRIAALGTAALVCCPQSASAYGPYTFSDEATHLLSSTPHLLEVIRQSLDVERQSKNIFPEEPMIFAVRPKGSQGKYALELLIWNKDIRNDKPRIEIRYAKQ